MDFSVWNMKQGVILIAFVIMLLHLNFQFIQSLVIVLFVTLIIIIKYYY